jgi:hypothetical protein
MSGPAGDVLGKGCGCMSARDDAEDNGRSPAQQAQQPQPVHKAQDEGLGARAASLSGLLDGNEKKPGEKAAGRRAPDLDQARFSAGVVLFYEAVLKEPIPEKMLRLIAEIGKRERQP